MTTQKIYTEENIVTMPFGESVQKKLGMYLTSDLPLALRLGLRELVYNSQDEFEQGFGNEINIVVDTAARQITVQDNARGIPCGEREDGVNALVAACTLPHSGAKHDTEVYAGAVGINGIGLKVVCHTSDVFQISSVRDLASGQYDRFIFTGSEKGAILQKHDKLPITKGMTTGTTIAYEPSKRVYHDHWLDKEELFNDMQELSYFAKGLKINVTFDKEKKTFISKRGLADALARKKAIHSHILDYQKEIEGVKVELALQWVKENPNLMPYANNLHVPEGGPFITGFKTALTKAFNSSCGTNYSGDIIRRYLDGYVSVKVGIPQFSNQSKTSLANPEARTAVSKATTEAIKQFFDRNKDDLNEIKKLLDREQKAEKAAERAREAERSIIQGNKKSKLISDFPTKLSDATGGILDKKELYICEGDSAAAILKKIRNPQIHGILPIRGKIRNSFSLELAEAIKNEEIKGIITTLGCGAGSLTNTKNLRYDKVIIASDADADGAHIALLLESLFLIHMTPLIEEGRVYRVLAPLYIIENKLKKIYLYNDQELNEYQNQYGTQHIVRAKGLGAMDDEDTYTTLLDPKTRRLQQLTTADLEKTIAKFNVLMGRDLAARRALASSIDYTVEESEAL